MLKAALAIADRVMDALYEACRLAIVGGLTGLFCVSLAGILSGQWRPLMFFASMLNPLAWVVASAIALCGTIMLPTAYYLTRRSWPVTPIRYAWMGIWLALALVVCAHVATIVLSRPARTDPIELIYNWYPASLGALLAGIICGWLFGSRMQEDYQRYLRTRIEKA